jgi:hypothetical protein
VYEFVFGAELKESVMRRRQDDWINATHILKAAGFDKVCNNAEYRGQYLLPLMGFFSFLSPKLF